MNSASVRLNSGCFLEKMQRVQNDRVRTALRNVPFRCFPIRLEECNLKIRFLSDNSRHRLPQESVTACNEDDFTGAHREPLLGISNDLLVTRPGFT